MELTACLCLVLVAVIAVNSAENPTKDNADVENTDRNLRRILDGLLHKERDTTDVKARATQGSSENQVHKGEANVEKARAHEAQLKKMLEKNLKSAHTPHTPHTQNRRKKPVRFGGQKPTGRARDKRAHVNGHAARNGKRNHVNNLHDRRGVRKNNQQKHGATKRGQQQSKHDNQREQVDRYYNYDNNYYDNNYYDNNYYDNYYPYYYPDYYPDYYPNYYDYQSDDGSSCSCYCSIKSAPTTDYGYTSGYIPPTPGYNNP